MDNMTRSQASRTRQKSKADARRIAENVPQHTKPAPKERSSLEKLGIVAGLIGSLAAVVAAVFAILAYTNQISASQSANAATLEQYASQVYYTLGPLEANKTQDVVITNDANAPISNVVLNFPQPVQDCGSPCNWVGYDYVNLGSIPGCKQLTANLLSIFSHPSIGIKSENGSRMNFTDRNGNTWAEYGAENNRLVQLQGYKPPVGLLTLPATGLTTVPGCT